MIADRQLEIDDFIREHWPDPQPQPSAGPSYNGRHALSDEDVLRMCREANNGAKFIALYAGDPGGYPSESEADLALVTLMTFYTQDRAQLERLWRRSALWRGKAENRPDYVKRTIDRALNRSEFWEPVGSNGTGANSHNGRTDPGNEAADDEEDEKDRNTAKPNPAANIPAAPRFPIEAFPADIRAYLVAAAKSVGDSPIEMVAMPFLAAAGALIGNRLVIQLKCGYWQMPTLYVAIVADPGTGKSILTAHGHRALTVMQTEEHDAYKQRLATYKTDLRRWKDAPPGERGDEPTLEPERDFYSTDLTTEALAKILSKDPGVALVREELSGWVATMDQYRGGGKGGDRQVFLSLWSGEVIRVNRRTGETVTQSWPVAAVIGGIQPDLLPMLHSRDGKREGFIERVLLIRPDADYVPWTEDELDLDALEKVLTTFKQLDEKLPPRNGRTVWTTQLHPHAKQVWKDFYADNTEAAKAAVGLRRGFFAKLPNQVARFALILHALHTAGTDPQVMVSAATMADAVKLGEFCRLHIERCLPLIGIAALTPSDMVKERIRRLLRDTANEGGWVSRRDLLHGLGNVLAVDLTAALSELETAAEIESRTRRTATNTAEEWRICLQSPIDHSRNSTNSTTDDPLSGNCANCSNGQPNMHKQSGAADDEWEDLL